MITLSGKSVFGGVAIGKIAFYKRQEKQVRRYHVCLLYTSVDGTELTLTEWDYGDQMIFEKADK